MNGIIRFADEAACNTRLAGGKGANLGRLARNGFPVPAGFVISTEAYLEFLRAAGLDRRIVALADALAYDDPDALEEGTAKIRSLIEDEVFPAALRDAIEAAYGELGANPYVAVRSSGAAEDLEGASFAGLHDTYLDVRNSEPLLDAVRRCWASLWSARAVSYRHTKGYDHFDSPIAVVVQLMIESEVSGVLFTGNPINCATDEIVINASWGLGEAVVQGITTPDQFIVRSGTLAIIERTLGSKTKQVVRDPLTGLGTVARDTMQQLREIYSLTDTQVERLAELSRRIQESYGEFPQDIEWALADGEFHILQARPVTGVEFSWDADVNASIPGDAPDDQLWSRKWADEIWTGAISPLMFSWRTQLNNDSMSFPLKTFGFPELHHSKVRAWNFHKSQVYYNPSLDLELIKKTVPPALRPGMADKLPTAWRQEAINSDFDWLRYARMYLRLELLEPQMGLRFTSTLQRILDGDTSHFDGLPYERLALLSNHELKKYIRRMSDMEGEFYHVIVTGLVFIFRDTLALLGYAIANWYDGDNPAAFADVMTGVRVPTATTVENHDLWQLGESIRTSAQLRETFDAHPGAAFFAQCERSEEGRRFLDAYKKFIVKHGHRGHSDRDIYFTRRAEDPAVDYRALHSLLSAPGGVAPEIREREVNARSIAAVEEIAQNIAQKPMGSLKAAAFRKLVDYAHKIVAARDNERYLIDRSTFAVKRGFQEIGRRLRTRGLIETDRDVFFLTMDELYTLLDGRANLPLTTAKIRARAIEFDRVDTKEKIPPAYMRRDMPVDVDLPAPQAGDGILRGVGTSRGKITGTARVVKTLKEISRVKSGDIMITNSTDPGWTPVFLVIGGLVLETGGILAHGALLSREYGLPAVQVDGALQLIPDGATITVDGDSGRVTIVAKLPEAETAIAA